ncbi:protein c8orf37 homolog [Plakobranchus ocellatus]|uniref:Cilia- and flagella-associated protein 418 n=1 Tax=Plakobranchus ocellatus TaxID=259542 RepID=A0AAV4C3Q9_9GAST|nr:protein c8orf37 homolog [Plakobranchus ocellatus]
MEDIDDLLDEVETKYVKKTAGTTSVTTPDYELKINRHSQGSSKKNRSTDFKFWNLSLAMAILFLISIILHLPSEGMRYPSSAIDAAIDDILDLDLDDNCSKEIHKTSSIKSSISREAATGVEQSRRCLPVYLGGSNESLGLGSSVNQRSCDQLRCTSCDFRVCTFDNMAWKKDTDYLFLRNNVPDFDKLKPKLIKKKGWRAYCCQCCWRNVLDLTELSDSSLNPQQGDLRRSGPSSGQGTGGGAQTLQISGRIRYPLVSRNV